MEFSQCNEVPNGTICFDPPPLMAIFHEIIKIWKLPEPTGIGGVYAILAKSKTNQLLQSTHSEENFS